MRVIVLGHSGFIGRHLCEVFEEKKRHEFIGLSYPDFDLTDPTSAETLADLFTPDVGVIFLSGIKRQLGDSLEIFAKNMTMVTRVAEVLENHPVKRLVYVSSAAVYGEEVHNTSISEETPVAPMSNYGISKFASECLLAKVAAAHEGMSVVSVRPPLVYGPGDESRSYGPAGFVATALEGGTITLWGDGSELREFLYVKDLAEILHEMLDIDCEGVINAVSGKSQNFQDVLKAIETVLGKPLKIEQRERSKQKVDNAFDEAVLKSMLPDFDFTGLEKGVRGIAGG